MEFCDSLLRGRDQDPVGRIEKFGSQAGRRGTVPLLSK